VALVYNWWNLFTRLADPEHHREALTSRPLLLSTVARQTQHAGQVTLSISSTHGMRDTARQAYVRIAGFLANLRISAEQLDPLAKWYRILTEALRHFLHGRQLQPPLRLGCGAKSRAQRRAPLGSFAIPATASTRSPPQHRPRAALQPTIRVMRSLHSVTLVFGWTRRVRTMKQSFASAARLRGGGPILTNGST
jgi:hypothetical protein